MGMAVLVPGERLRNRYPAALDGGGRSMPEDSLSPPVQKSEFAYYFHRIGGLRRKPGAGKLLPCIDGWR